MLSNGIGFRIPSSAQIMVVEDEAIIAMDLEHLLLAHGAGKIIVAHSLQEACLKLMRNDQLDLVMVDLKLRDGSGAELIQVLRNRNIPVIITTGYSTIDSQGILTVEKPYSAEQLLAVIAQVLK